MSYRQLTQDIKLGESRDDDHGHQSLFGDVVR